MRVNVGSRTWDVDVRRGLAWSGTTSFPAIQAELCLWLWLWEIVVPRGCPLDGCGPPWVGDWLRETCQPWASPPQNPLVPATLQLVGVRGLGSRAGQWEVCQVGLPGKLYVPDEYAFFALWQVPLSPCLESKREAWRGEQQPLCNHEATWMSSQSKGLKYGRGLDYQHTSVMQQQKRRGPLKKHPLF